MLLTVVAAALAAETLQVEHTPPACFLADKVPRLVACLAPRAASTRASVRILFRADGATAWYAASLRYDVPCFWGVLPRPSRTSGRVVYVLEAQAAGVTARSREHEVPVAAEAGACAGRPATVAENARPAWEAPPGAPRTPPGFEGTRTTETRTAEAPAAAPPAAPFARPPAPAPKAPVSGPPASPPAESEGGHGVRNVALVAAGIAAAGGAAVAVRNGQDSGTPATTLGSGLPATGVAGTYVGTETVSYGGGCTGTDDVVLSLQEAGGLLSGVLSFTVRECACCAAGRGANPVSGARSGLNLQLSTPIGFEYSGAFAGNRLSGSLSGPRGITGSWTVDKQ